MNKLKNFIILSLCILLFACVSNTSGPLYTTASSPNIEKDSSQLVMFRSSGWMMADGPEVLINGEKKCDLFGNAVIFIDVPIGKNKIAVGGPLSIDIKLDIDAKIGKRYYIRVKENEAKWKAGNIAGTLGILAYNAANKGNNSDYFLEVLNSNSAAKILPKTHMQKCAK